MVGNVDDTSNISEEGNHHDDRFRQGPRPPGGRPSPPPPPPPPGRALYRRPTYGAEEEDRTEIYDVKFPWREYENINPKEMDSLDIVDPTTSTKNRHRYLLCPKKVIGFVLKSRNWGMLCVGTHTSKLVTNQSSMLTLTRSARYRVLQ